MASKWVVRQLSDQTVPFFVVLVFLDLNSRKEKNKKEKKVKKPKAHIPEPQAGSTNPTAIGLVGLNIDIIRNFSHQNKILFIYLYIIFAVQSSYLFKLIL